MLAMLQANPDPPQGAARLQPLDAFEGSLAQRVYASLRGAIMRMDFAPGEILRKGEICGALGVSRSPVGEAMARLAAEGLVDVQPQAGSFVARFSMDEIREGAFLREALELAAVEAVAPGITPAQVAGLEAIIARQEAAVARGDQAAFMAEDAALHEAILTLTGHRHLAALSRTAWVHVDRARQLVLPRPGRMAETLAEHRAIVAALAAHDAGAARAATQAHLGQLLTIIAPLVEDRPDLFAPA